MAAPRDFYIQLMFGRHRVVELSECVGMIVSKIMEVFIKDEVFVLL